MSQAFVKIAAKHLSKVEMDKLVSNQHEFNGVAALKQLLGTQKQTKYATFIYYDDSRLINSDSGYITLYDETANNPTRTEYRLYYTESSIINRANVNDLLVIGLQSNGMINIIIARNGSSKYNMLMNYIFSEFNIYDNIAI